MDGQTDIQTANVIPYVAGYKNDIFTCLRILFELNVELENMLLYEAQYKKKALIRYAGMNTQINAQIRPLIEASIRL